MQTRTVKRYDSKKAKNTYINKTNWNYYSRNYTKYLFYFIDMLNRGEYVVFLSTYVLYVYILDIFTLS